MTDKNMEPIRSLLHFIYAADQAEKTFRRLQTRLLEFQKKTHQTFQPNEPLFNEQDIILITYGDSLQRTAEKPLQTLLSFHQAYSAETINSIHILPFFPYSSDDGFAVIDYHAVNPQLGNWQDIENFEQKGVRLMFDAVINHISAKSEWFQQFLLGNPHYQAYFISVPPESDLSGVTRPRTLPLLTPVQTTMGTQSVWTTFSDDQIDLNYQNPDTLLSVVDILLDYVEHGAKLIRLDAIAYLWKEIGTSCIHLPQTHAVVQLLRAVLDVIAPGVLIITETNVPHAENISYFGNGSNEAHLVYQFALPPLCAHALISGTARYLSEWAAGLTTLSAETTFFNFSASHDGIGVRPVSDLLPAAEVQRLVQTCLQHGGQYSSKTNSDGTTSPYELNINYFDLLNDPTSVEDQAIQVRRFLVSQAIVLCMAGIPGVYIHSLLGSRNDRAGVQRSGQVRSINREKLDADAIRAALQQPGSLRAQVFVGYQHLLRCRKAQKAFHPNAAQRVLRLHAAVFAVLRSAQDESQHVLALHNVSAKVLTLALDAANLPDRVGQTAQDLLSGRDFALKDTIQLQPYEVLWLAW